MNGINDHVIRNSPFVNVRVMKRWKPLACDEQLKAEMSRDSENVRSHPIKSVATSVCAIRELDAIDFSFERSLLHWLLFEIDINFGSFFVALFIFRVDCFLNSTPTGCYETYGSYNYFRCSNSCHETYGPCDLYSVQSRMAETHDLNSVGQFAGSRITVALRVLKGLSEGTIAAKTPSPFRDTRGSNFRLISDEDTTNQWIRFGMPPAVVYSAYFANSRHTSEATAQALEVAYKLLQRAQDIEKGCSGWEFLSKGSRFVKVFASRCPYDDATVGTLHGQRDL